MTYLGSWLATLLFAYSAALEVLKNVVGHVGPLSKVLNDLCKVSALCMP